MMGILLTIPLLQGFSQRIFSARGIAKIRLEENMSREETRDIAIQQARQNAIETIFGLYVSKDAYIDVADGDTDVRIISASELKGEWLKTTSEVFSEETRKIKDEYGSRNEIWIVSEVKGKVREIETPLIRYSFETKNCVLDECETTDFQNGESLYITFISPSDGFLSIYLVDEQKAFRILPYQEMPSSYLHTIPVKADKEYIFFSVNKSYDYFENYSYFLTDEIYLETDKEMEFFKVYVLFSPKPFSKPILDAGLDVAGEYGIPKALTKRNFEVWVQDNRIFDTDFYFQTKNIRVRK